ncbi:MAG: DUF58 domain-containing protein [Gammaproteobacteria bacterium]|nr:DUF58 domain-containing protein [Gammaproteobacteria bacterium]
MRDVSRDAAATETASASADGPALKGAYTSLEELLALRHLRARALPRRAKGRRVGMHESRRKGRGIDLDEVREYQPGDDARYIDWRVTARKAHAHIRVFREERELPTLIVVDQTRSMFFGSVARLKSVAAAEVAALTAWRALQAGDRVGGVVIGEAELAAFRPHRSSVAVGRFLAAVAKANQALSTVRATTDSLARLPETLARLAPANQRIVVISDFAAPEDWLDAVTALASRNATSFVAIFDPLERRLPRARRAFHVSDGMHRVRFDAGLGGDDYQRRFDHRMELLAAHCRDAGIDLTTIATNDPTP